MNRTSLVVTLALGASGCGLFGGGSGATYYRVGIGQFTTPSGTNCQNLVGPGTACQYLSNVNCANSSSGELTEAFWTIYPGANNAFFLDGALNGTLMGGTQASGAYTFKGSNVQENKAPNYDNVDEKDYVVTVTPKDSGFTGNIAVTETINCQGSACPNNGGSSNCENTSQVTGVQLTNVTEFSTESPGQSNTPTSGGVSGGVTGGGNGGGTTGGNGTTSGGNNGTSTGATTGSLSGNYNAAGSVGAMNAMQTVSGAETVNAVGNNMQISNFGAPALGNCSNFTGTFTGFNYTSASAMNCQINGQSVTFNAGAVAVTPAGTTPVSLGVSGADTTAMYTISFTLTQ